MQRNNSKEILSQLTSFLINLEDRPDRLMSAELEAKKLGLSLHRVDAIKSTSAFEGESLLSPAATACWESHKKALSLFLESKNNHCLILEDDFLVISPSGVSRSIAQIQLDDWDFIQLGFLNTGFRDRIQRILSNLETSVFRRLSSLAKVWLFRQTNFDRRLRVHRVRHVPSRFIPDDIRSGAHSYIISRDLAGTVLKLNNPAFLTADGFFSSLAWDKSFKMIRVRRSHINQSNSASSIRVANSRRNL